MRILTKRFCILVATAIATVTASTAALADRLVPPPGRSVEQRKADVTACKAETMERLKDPSVRAKIKAGADQAVGADILISTLVGGIGGAISAATSPSYARRNYGRQIGLQMAVQCLKRKGYKVIASSAPAASSGSSK